MPAEAEHPGAHIPVLLNAVVEGLRCREAGGLYVDCTLGGGGHAEAVLEAHPQNEVIGIDQDGSAVERAGRRLDRFKSRITLVEDNFCNLRAVLAALQVSRVRGILLDLGFSSSQVDDAGRGFSFRADGPLDMRMNPERGLTASQMVNSLGAGELQDIIGRFGEERYARRIALAIVKSRKEHPITRTAQLVRVIEKSVPPLYRYNKNLHFATRTFQALRIAVNDELTVLKKVLPDAVDVLQSQGRLAVISFHSLEDRMVKRVFRELSAECHCRPRTPVCVCNAKPLLRVINTKPIVPDADQIKANPRSRSSKLRVAEKLGG